MNITKILTEISKAIILSEDGESAFRKYDAMKSHDGWKVHQGFLIEIANQLSRSMLTREFTELSKDEKDAQQRALFISKEVIDFLIDPTKGARRYAAIQNHNQAMEATYKGSNRKGKK